MSNNRVYVGNLAYSVNNYELKNFMAQAGEVVRATVLCTGGRRSRGCGIVEFTTAEEAQNAIETLQNEELKGRAVFVREDREPPRSAAPPASIGTPVSIPGTQPPIQSFAASPAETEPKLSHSAAPLPVIQSSVTVPPARGSAKPGTAVFVTNLPFSVTWFDLKSLFAAAGEVVRADVHMIHHRSKGHGTVMYSSEQFAAKAIEQFDGYVWNGRQLEVRLDVPPSQRSGAFLWCSGFGDVSETVFVSNLPWNTTDTDLFELFQSIAPITRAQLQLFPDGRQTGNGVVKFESQANAEIAVKQLNGYNYGSRSLHVSFARYQNSGEHP